MTSAGRSTEPLIEQCQGLVRSLAASIHRKLPPHFDLEDLIAYGQVGLAEAARDFDPERGSQFSTYAYYRIRGAIYDGLSKMTWFSRSQYSQACYEQRANDVFQANAEESSGMSHDTLEDDARWFRDLSRTLAVVYITSHTTESGAKPMEVFVDTCTPPEAAIDAETTRLLQAQIDTLPADEAKFIRALYFEGLTLQQAGEQSGISKSWASRLHVKVLQHLSRSLRQIGMGV